MKKWKIYEELTGKIFKSLKANPEIIVRTNVLVPDIRGDDRQIDVLIEHQISKIPVCVAIECKHHKHPISVKYIEAFNSKCERIPSIHRKIFVSKHGYQSGAISAARDFKIELYILEDIIENVSALSLLNNYQFSIDKRLCVPFTVKVWIDGSDPIIYKGPTNVNLKFTNNQQTENIWTFPNSVTFNMPVDEFKSFLGGKFDGRLKKVPIRIFPTVETHLEKNDGSLIGKVACVDLYLKISGEIIKLNQSSMRSLRKQDKNETIVETKEYIGKNKLGETTFLDFVNSNDNIVKVFCTITDKGKAKYEHSENWYLSPELFTSKICP